MKGDIAVLSAAVLWRYSSDNFLWEYDKRWLQKNLVELFQVRGKTIGNNASDIALNGAETVGFVSDSLADNVKIIDLGSQKILKTLSTGSMPSHIAVTCDGHSLFVVNRLDKTVSKLDVQTGREDS